MSVRRRTSSPQIVDVAAPQFSFYRVKDEFDPHQRIDQRMIAARAASRYSVMQGLVPMRDFG